MIIIPFALFTWYKTTAKKIFVDLTFTAILLTVRVMLVAYYWFLYDAILAVTDDLNAKNAYRETFDALLEMFLKISLMIGSTIVYIKL